LATFRFDVGDVDPPRGWKNQSITAFRFRSSNKGSGDASIVISQDDDAIHDSLEVYAERHAKTFRQQFPQFEMLTCESLTMDGLPALHLDYCWQSPGARLRQCQAIVHIGVTILIFTLTARFEDIRQHADAWNAFLVSFRLRKPDSASSLANKSQPSV
jgi:hypothetical protein